MEKKVKHREDVTERCLSSKCGVTKKIDWRIKKLVEDVGCKGAWVCEAAVLQWFAHIERIEEKRYIHETAVRGNTEQGTTK